MTAQVRQRMTYAEYLAAEETATEKHDFINGEVYAMAGGTREHGALSLAVGAEIRAALAGKPIRAFSSDVRIRVESTGASFYPDVSVVRGQVVAAKEDDQSIANPLVLVEVLSESTEAYDRGAKAGHYRRIPSLREYVLISQNERRVEVQRLNEKGTWEFHFYGPGEHVELTSTGVRFSVDAVYANPLG